MKRFFLMLSTVAILSSCASNEVDLNQIAPINTDQTNIQTNKENENDLIFNSSKIRMDMMPVKLDGKEYSYSLPSILVKKDSNEELLFDRANIKGVGWGYLVASKDGKVYMEPWNKASRDKYSLNDTITCYEIGAWAKKGTVAPKYSELVNFEPSKDYKYSSEYKNSKTLSLTFNKSPNLPINRKRSDMLVVIEK